MDSKLLLGIGLGVLLYYAYQTNKVNRQSMPSNSATVGPGGFPGVSGPKFWRGSFRNTSPDMPYGLRSFGFENPTTTHYSKMVV